MSLGLDSPSGRSRSRRPAGALLVAVLCAAPLTAQIDEEDLPQAAETRPLEELRRHFQLAETSFLEAIDPAESLPLLTEVVGDLELSRDREQGAGEILRLLAAALGYRARAQFNLGALEAVDDDIHRILELEPEFEFDAAVVTPKLIERFQAVRNAVIGYLQLSLTPPDAKASIGGVPVAMRGGAIPLWSGLRTVAVERVGYAPAETEILVAAGKVTPLAIDLQRDSAVLRLSTRPPGASVAIDGEIVGVTAEQEVAEGAQPSQTPAYSRSRLSAEARFDGLLPGTYKLEVVKEGFRPFRRSLQITELIDQDIGPVTLEPTQAVIVLRGLPPGSEVTLNGVRTLADRTEGADSRFLVAPGEHLVVVQDGSGVFEASVALADRERATKQVALRPALTLAGVVGGDRVAAENHRETLVAAGANLARWTFLDRSLAGLELLAGHDLSAAELRTAAKANGQRSRVDWGELRRALDGVLPGSVYLIAVLSDDLVASSVVDLWFLASGSKLIRPDSRTIDLDASDELKRLLADIDRPVEFRQAWLGALLIDSDVAGRPVVADLAPDGPAATAGLLVGDEVLSVAGQTVATVAQCLQILRSLGPDSTAAFQLTAPDGHRLVEVKLGASPLVVAVNAPNVLYATAAVALDRAQAEARGGPPAWLISLSQAAVFLSSGEWEEAVRALRGTSGPKGPGIGQATADYWLGTALGSDPAYAGRARQALATAASAAGARLLHNDGPLVAPRARARLAALGSEGDG